MTPTAHVRIACLDGEPAVVGSDGVGRSLAPLVERPGCLDTPAAKMLRVIEGWDAIRAAISGDGLGALSPIDTRTARWSAPVPRPGKIVAAPVNYHAHGAEMHAHGTVEQLGVFLKAPSAVIGPSDQVELPFLDRAIDQEAELAVVMGRRARSVPAHQALDHVLGFTCLLDITMRGDEERSARKSYDTFAPMGPWIATRAEVGDPGSLRLRCWVNDELRQDASTAELIYDVPKLVSFASHIMTLEPGDVVSTGTPAGVGTLVPGDRIVVDVEKVGRLEVGVRGHEAGLG